MVLGWLLVTGISPAVNIWDLGLWGLWVERPPSEPFYEILSRVSKKTKENSEWLGQQTRPGIEPGTSRLPVLNTEPPCHWWGPCNQAKTSLQNFRSNALLLLSTVGRVI